MAKSYKVKRYYGGAENSFRAKPRLLTVIVVVLVFAGLCYLGAVMWGPVSKFVMSLGEPVDVSSLPEPEPAPSAPPEPESAPAPEPEPSAKSVFEGMAAVFLPHDIAADAARLETFLASLAGSGINCVMLDIKNDQGDILFKTENEQADKWNLIADNAIDLAALKAKLDGVGLKLAVKMSAFKDPKAARAGRTEYAIAYQDSNFLWLDDSPENGGLPWLNPYSPAAAGYLRALALEAIDLGAEYVALENVQFPDNSGVYASFGGNVMGMSRVDVLNSFIEELQAGAEERTARLGVWFPVTAITRTAGQENRYGGTILGTVRKELALDVSPAQYGGGIDENGLVIENPREKPAEAVSLALAYTKQGIPGDTKIMAVINTEGVEAATQIEAAKTAGAGEYVLYSESGTYTFGQ